MPESKRVGHGNKKSGDENHISLFLSFQLFLFERAAHFRKIEVNALALVGRSGCKFAIGAQRNVAIDDVVLAAPPINSRHLGEQAYLAVLGQSRRYEVVSFACGNGEDIFGAHTVGTIGGRFAAEVHLGLANAQGLGLGVNLKLVPTGLFYLTVATVIGVACACLIGHLELGSAEIVALPTGLRRELKLLASVQIDDGPEVTAGY